jgi:hypothetical protein
MNGTANNYLNGDTALGTTTLGTATKLTIGGSETASSAIARGGLVNTTLVASANNDVLVGLDVNPTFTNGAFTGVSSYAARFNGLIQSGNFRTGPTNLVSNTDNFQHIAIGNFINAGTSTNSLNIVVGGYEGGQNRRTGQSLTTGSLNVIIGYGNGSQITTGQRNTIIGHGAMISGGNSSDNTAYGANSLFNVSGNFNTAIGQASGFGTGTNANTSGANNIFIGHQSVGESATESNRTWIGNASTLSTWVGGNLLVGTRVNSTFALDVNGTARVSGQTTIRGSGNTTATIALFVTNSDNNALINIDNSGNFYFGQNGQQSYLSVTDALTPSLLGTKTLTNQCNVTISNNRVTTQALANGSLFVTRDGLETTTLSDVTNLLIVGHRPTQGFAPTSGGAILNAQRIAPIINQTGTANGITRGLYINPTLTAAADWRAIEWSNSTGWGLYGAGLANNYLAGELLIGTTTDSGQKLQVAGNAQVNHAYTHAAGAYTSGLSSFTDVTTGSSPSYTSGMFYGAFQSYYRNQFSANATIPTSAIQASQFNGTQIRFVNSGTAITMTQAAGIRAYASQILQFSVDNAQATCSVSHVAGIQIIAPYYQGANNPTIDNYYGLVLNDSAEYSATLTVTNRWAIYQDGASDNNYFKGKVVIGSTNTVGASPLNVKNLPTSSTGLASGDIWSNSGVLNVFP